MSFPRQPGTPSGFMSDIPPPALAAASFTPPAATTGYPVGGLVWDITGSLPTSDPGTDPIAFRWLECVGQQEEIALYPLLADRIGNIWETVFGVPTAGHFRLPNLRARFPLAPDGGVTYLTGAIGGEVNHTLTVAETPPHDHGSAGSHSHQVSASGAQLTQQPDAGGAFNGFEVHIDAVGQSLRNVIAESAGAHTHASVGGGAGHNNMPPYVVIPAFVRALP